MFIFFSVFLIYILVLHYLETPGPRNVYQIVRFFLCIHASAADAAAVNSKGIKTLLANGLITFFIKGNPVFSNGPRSLPRNPPDCTILDNLVFEKSISVDDLLGKTLCEDFQLVY